MDFAREFFCKIMYCHERMKINPCPFNMMFIDTIYLFFISEHNKRD